MVILQKVLFSQFPLLTLQTRADGAFLRERKRDPRLPNWAVRANESRSAGSFAQGSCSALAGRRSPKGCAFSFWCVCACVCVCVCVCNYIPESNILGTRGTTDVRHRLQTGKRSQPQSVNVKPSESLSCRAPPRQEQSADFLTCLTSESGWFGTVLACWPHQNLRTKASVAVGMIGHR